MARPRQSLSRVHAGVAQGINAVTLEADMGAQIQDTTLVANSAGAVNIVLNSLKTSNVAFQAYPINGYSYMANFSEVTSPTASAAFISVYAHGISAALGNINIPARVFLLQRGE